MEERIYTIDTEKKIHSIMKKYKQDFGEKKRYKVMTVRKDLTK